MIAALDRPGYGDHRARRRHAAGEIADAPGAQSGESRRPLRILRLTVGRAHEIGLELLVTRRVARQELAIVQLLDHQGMRETQHQRRVAAWPRGEPLGAELRQHVGAQRRDRNELAAVRLRCSQSFRHRVPPDAAGIHLRVLRRQSAERHDQFRVLGDHRPGRRAIEHETGEIADDMRHQRAHRRIAVCVDRGRVAADAVEESVQLALRVMEPASARPAIGAAENRLLPCALRTRSSSAAASALASSQETATNGSRPRPVRSEPGPFSRNPCAPRAPRCGPDDARPRRCPDRSPPDQDRRHSR